MKSICRYLLTLALLTMVVACGKDNKSGKSDPYMYGNPYSSGTYSPAVSGLGIAYGNFNLDAVLGQTYCMTTGYPNQNRMRIQFPLQGYPTAVQQGDLYVGVTTAGDVAVLVGQGGANPPLFIAFMCQRAYATSGQGQLADLAIGTATKCMVKPLVRATMVVPGFPQPLYFRQLDGGRLDPQSGRMVPYSGICY